MEDPYHLERFVAAQKDSFETAIAEIRRGRKRSHWMWWIFPQLAGLGRSATSQRYAIGTVEEARAYLADPLLGPRLVASVQALQELSAGDADAVFGPVDAMKLRSSLTLFEAADGGPLFSAALDRWFAGSRDPATLAALGRG